MIDTKCLPAYSVIVFYASCQKYAYAEIVSAARSSFVPYSNFHVTGSYRRLRGNASRPARTWSTRIPCWTWLIIPGES